MVLVLLSQPAQLVLTPEGRVSWHPEVVKMAGWFPLQVERPLGKPGL
jgi:hypothetical protein